MILRRQQTQQQMPRPRVPNQLLRERRPPSMPLRGISRVSQNYVRRYGPVRKLRNITRPERPDQPRGDVVRDGFAEEPHHAGGAPTVTDTGGWLTPQMHRWTDAPALRRASSAGVGVHAEVITGRPLITSSRIANPPQRPFSASSQSCGLPRNRVAFSIRPLIISGTARCAASMGRSEADR